MAYYWLGLSVSGSGADCDWLREHIAYYWLGLSVSAEVVWLVRSETASLGLYAVLQQQLEPEDSILGSVIRTYTLIIIAIG